MSLRQLLSQIQLLSDEAISVLRESGCAPEPVDPRRLELTQLEDRVLLSASPVAPVVADVIDSGSSDAAMVAVATSETGGTQIDASAPDTLDEGHMLDVLVDSTLPPADVVAITDDAADESGIVRELVFVDAAVENLDQLLQDLETRKADGAGIDYVLLESDRNGFAQITEALIDHQELDAIHIVSHGTDGSVKLGNTWLSGNNVDSLRSVLQGWGHSMSDGADLLFYGCNLAASDDGRELMLQVAAECDCDVAASDDLTGHADSTLR